MAYPATALVTTKTNSTSQTTDHPTHHNALAAAVNEIIDQLGRSATQLKWAADGGVGSPSYSWTSDTDCGLYRVSNNCIALAVGGSQLIEVSATGNILRGSTTITAGNITGITDLAVADGGTGSSTAAGARTNLGLGSMATQNNNAVNITGGSIAGITDLAVADGGTGGSDAATARTNLGAAASGAATGSGLTVSATDKILGRVSSGAGAIEEITCTTAGRAILDDATAADQRTTLGAAASGVATGSGLTVSAGDKILGRVTAGAGAIEEITCTTAGRAIIDDATAADQRTTLGLGTMAVQTAAAMSVSLVPGTTITYDLGDPSHAWSAAYVGTGYVATCYISTILSVDSGAQIDVNDTTDATGVTGTVGSIVTLGGISAAKQVLAPNLVRFAEFQMVASVKALLGASNIVTFLVFDETGATTTITDRSGNGYNATLGGNASGLTPQVAGLCPNLAFAGASATSWTVADDAAHSHVNSSFSLVVLAAPTNIAGRQLLSKYDTSGDNREYRFACDGSARMYFYLNEYNSTDRVGIIGSSAAPTDGTWNVYAAVSDGGTPEAYTDLHIYLNGAAYSTAQTDSGTYTGMTAGAATLCPSLNDASGWMVGRYGVVIETSTAIDADTMQQLSDILRSYAGVDL